MLFCAGNIRDYSKICTEFLSTNLLAVQSKRLFCFKWLVFGYSS